VVNELLEFYPHDSKGVDIFASYQSSKWREVLSRESRVQMVAVGAKHYYIYEPVSLKRHNPQLVIPIFFYQQQGLIYAKCVIPKIVYKHPTPAGLVDFAVTIPHGLEYQSHLLMEIPVSEFDLACSELSAPDGSSFLDQCRHTIVGQLINK
jgi:hypothetical protein